MIASRYVLSTSSKRKKRKTAGDNRLNSKILQAPGGSCHLELLRVELKDNTETCNETTIDVSGHFVNEFNYLIGRLFVADVDIQRSTQKIAPLARPLKLAIAQTVEFTDRTIRTDLTSGMYLPLRPATFADCVASYQYS